MNLSQKCLSNFVIVCFFLLQFMILFTVTLSRKSEEKCEEYSKLVYEFEASPVLRIGAGFINVSRCAIVETPLIVGGVKAKTAEFPHMAAIGFGKNLSDISWECGGSIISEKYILSAAHCLESRNKDPATMVRVDYRLPSKYHDLGLIELDRPLELNSRVRPACLEVHFQPPGKKAIATGFGKTAFDATFGSKDLMKVQLDYISKKDCKKRYQFDLGSRYLPEGFIPNLFCAGVMEGGKDTCQGDSGGPLQRVLVHPYCTYSIVGITSFGKFCAYKNSPAVYTRVSSYLDWIESIVWPQTK
ncbi:PREDICTED: serine protease snake-like isoform X2 [Polistes dominula]|uniref:Serine protease snake-like isoform X2 n=1 Tax=Polistes dominula TaxID=743375 RepID=A0ABM1IE60_POLDO|nr:PREDICTED: serine protease snake-like isoform X2 [Polistes dominula]